MATIAIFKIKRHFRVFRLHFFFQNKVKLKCIKIFEKYKSFVLLFPAMEGIDNSQQRFLIKVILKWIILNGSTVWIYFDLFIIVGNFSNSMVTLQVQK